MHVDDPTTLVQCFNDPNMSRQFLNLLNGVSPKYEQHLREKQDQPFNVNL
jgi:hypothetical protein